jgi:hypothetical protein
LRYSLQIYGYISRHLDADNYKGKWSDEEKEMLTRLVEEKGAKWKDIGILAQTRSHHTCATSCPVSLFDRFSSSVAAVQAPRWVEPVTHAGTSGA